MRPTTKVVRSLPHKDRREIATTRPLAVCIRWSKGGGLEPGGSSPLQGQGRPASRRSPAPCAFRSSAVHLRVSLDSTGQFGNCQVTVKDLGLATYIAKQDSGGGNPQANTSTTISRQADKSQHGDKAPQ